VKGVNMPLHETEPAEPDDGEGEGDAEGEGDE
jgi:hypothetical protein